MNKFTRICHAFNILVKLYKEGRAQSYFTKYTSNYHILKLIHEHLSLAESKSTYHERSDIMEPLSSQVHFEISQDPISTTERSQHRSSFNEDKNSNNGSSLAIDNSNQLDDNLGDVAVSAEGNSPRPDTQMIDSKISANSKNCNYLIYML